MFQTFGKKTTWQRHTKERQLGLKIHVFYLNPGKIVLDSLNENQSTGCYSDCTNSVGHRKI